MERSRKECEDQAAKNLSYTQAEGIIKLSAYFSGSFNKYFFTISADSLREELMATEDQLRKRTSDLQAKLRNMEHSKNEEIKHLTYDVI